MSEILGIGAVEGLYGHDETKEDLSEALERVSMDLRFGPMLWANVAGTYIVIKSICSDQEEASEGYAFDKLRKDITNLTRKVFFTRWDHQLIVEDIRYLAMEQPVVEKQQLRDGLLSCLKPLLKEVDNTYSATFLNIYKYHGIVAELKTIAQILSSTHLTPKLREKGEDLKVSLGYYGANYGHQTYLFFQTEIMQLIDLLEKG